MDYELFSVTSRLDGKQYECRFRDLITGIAPRHSDTADIRFLVNGRPVVVALPLVALSEYRKRAGRALTDAEVIQIASLCLKDLLEKETVGEDGMVCPSAEQTLDIAARLST